MRYGCVCVCAPCSHIHTQIPHRNQSIIEMHTNIENHPRTTCTTVVQKPEAANRRIQCVYLYIWSTNMVLLVVPMCDFNSIALALRRSRSRRAAHLPARAHLQRTLSPHIVVDRISRADTFTAATNTKKNKINNTAQQCVSCMHAQAIFGRPGEYV